ncbi:MAG: DUF6463 family protein [Pacificimonas sp.]|jgi:hypothetical protein|nr:DUF6463 family protein [Pacificimonas sp.]
MLRWAGPVLIAFALFHGVMSFILFGEPLATAAAQGPASSLAWNGFELAGWWFLLWTLPALLFGILAKASHDRFGTIPAARALGLLLLSGVILSGVFLTASGLWAYAVPALMLIIGRGTEPGSR